MRWGCIAIVVALWAGIACAQEASEVPVETAELGQNVVTLHLYPFLTEEELALLRLVATNEDALALFVPQQDGAVEQGEVPEPGKHAAMAVSPVEGVLRDGVPVPSAIAVGQLPDAETARASATEQCNAAREKQRKRDPECVVVLEVMPKT
jgi:hypothetical protein